MVALTETKPLLDTWYCEPALRLTVVLPPVERSMVSFVALAAAAFCPTSGDGEVVNACLATVRASEEAMSPAAAAPSSVLAVARCLVLRLEPCVCGT